MLSRYPALLLLAGSCLAQDTARMDQIVQSYAGRQEFMGTVLVARGDEVLFNKAYGSANLEWDVPNTPATKFRLGSISKQFTAACILLLEERGKLKTGDPIKQYMPDAPAAWDKVTFFHLLTHTSGIPSFTEFPEYSKLEPFPTTPEKLVALFRDKKLEFEPGESWKYDNSGYVLLTYLLEKISGEKYEAFVRDNIFTPLGMKDSGYDSNSAIIAHRASGYTPNGGHLQNAGYINMTVPQGAGALYSTTGDLFKWEQGLFGGKVLKPGSLEKMTTPFKQDYAFGLAVTTEKGHKRIEHGGGIEGFNTTMSYFPEDKLTVIALSNVNGRAVEEIATRLTAVAQGETVTLTSERKEVTLDAKVLGRYVGSYQMPGNGAPAILITLEGNQLSEKLGGQQTFPIFPESETMFFLKVVDAQIEFPKDDGSGHASQLTLHQGGRDQVAKRMDDAAAKKVADEAALFAQRYKDQKAAPGSDAAVRALVEGLASGKPNYDAMSSAFADLTRRNLSQMQPQIAGLGAVQTVTFKGVGPGGADIYEVKLEKGAIDCRIWMAPDGKIDRAGLRPM